MNSPSNNLFVGKVSEKIEEIDSTNEYAKLLVSKSKPPEGAVIIARKQTGGKGQFGKTWESEPGKNLTFSIILYPVFLEARRAYALNQVVSLALRDFLAGLDVPVKIKWPNDIYFHDKKLAGLLIENGLLGEDLSYSIIGIGLNMNQTDFNPELPNPVSLKMIAGKEYNLQELLDEACASIERRYLQLRTGRMVEIKREFEESLYLLGEKRLYRASHETFEGIIRGVDDAGRMMIETDGSMMTFERNDVGYE